MIKSAKERLWVLLVKLMVRLIPSDYSGILTADLNYYHEGVLVAELPALGEGHLEYMAW